MLQCCLKTQTVGNTSQHCQSLPRHVGQKALGGYLRYRCKRSFSAQGCPDAFSNTPRCPILCMNCQEYTCWDSKDRARWGNGINEIHLCVRCCSQYFNPPEQVSNPLAQAKGDPCDSQVKQSGPRAAAEVENPILVRPPLHVQAEALYAPPEVTASR